MDTRTQGQKAVVNYFSKAVVICATSLMLSTPTMADNTYEPPGFGLMTADLLITRPITLATTVVGSAIFLLSSPFAALGGNVGQSADTLVTAPFKATFSRCLGCAIRPEHGAR